MSAIERPAFPSAKITRRRLLQTTALVGAGLMAPHSLRRRAYAQLTGGTLDPDAIPKYVDPLVVPPAMPKTSTSGKIDYYEIAVRQFEQQVLPGGMPMTTVWSYGSVDHPETFNYPAFTIEAQVGRPVRVKWINDLVDHKGRFLPHLLPVDPTLHWANPPGGEDGRDMRPEFARTPRPYTGPVPIVTHLHGGHSAQESDGYAEAWYLPDAKNIPRDFATEGTFYEFFRDEFLNKFGVAWEPGTATFHYDNDQPATTIWYHDHTLGITRLNVYAGPAGFYLLRGGRGDLPDGVLPGPRRASTMIRLAGTTRSRSRSRTARSTMTARCSIRTAASSSTPLAVDTFRTATCRRSGIRSSSATPSWSTGARGRSSRWSRAVIVSGS